MTRRQFTKAVTAGALAAPPLPGQQRRRNLVLIIAHDHRTDFMGCTWHPWLKTPNLDRLVRGGALFENGFATPTVCGPSRAGIHTGL